MNKKCKGTGKAIDNGCGLNKQIFRYGLCKSCFIDWLYNTEEGSKVLKNSLISSKKKVMSEMKQASRNEKKEMNTSKAMQLADMYFSRYIRLTHSENQLCTCYTCSKILPIKQVDNGHYQKREHKATRYHENNCRPQCKVCNGNTKYNGNQVEFRINLINEIGLEAVIELETLAKTTISVNTRFYLDIAECYRIKVNAIQKELGIKVF